MAQEEKDSRVEFCKRMLKRPGRLLVNILYSDETGMNLSEAHRDKQWQDPNKRVKLSLPKRDVRLSCWGAICLRGATSLSLQRNLNNRPVSEYSSRAPPGDEGPVSKDLELYP